MEPVPHDPKPHKRPFFGIISLLLGVSAVLGFAVVTAPLAVIIAVTSLYKKEEQRWLSISAILLSALGILLAIWLYFATGSLTIIDSLSSVQ